MPFWEFKPESAYVAFNEMTFIESALKRIANARTKGDVVSDVLELALRQAQAQLMTPDVLAA